MCGVNTGLPGFSAQDDKGNWSGFDVDFCRAIAAAIFDDPKKVQVRAARRQGALRGARQAQGRRAGAQLDLDDVARDRVLTCTSPACRTTTARASWCRARATWIPRSRSTAARSACRADTTTELNLADYFRANNMKYRGEGSSAPSTRCSRPTNDGQCDTLTADVSQLYALRLKPGEARRPCHPGRRHLQGAAGAGGAAEGRRLAAAREVDAVCHDQRRGARHQLARTSTTR